MGIKYNSKGQILEIYTTSSFDYVPYLLEDEFVINLDNPEINGTEYYIYNETAVRIPEKPNFYSEFNWTTKEWEFPSNYLEVAKSDYKAIVNSISGDKILEKYPTYRQINYNREPTAQNTIDMNIWIDGIRAESNIANESIALADNLETLETIVTNFKIYLEDLQ